MNSQLSLKEKLMEKIEFNGYDEWFDFCENINSDFYLKNNQIKKAILEACQNEDFTENEMENFIVDDLTTDNIEKVNLYKDRLAVHFKDVEFCEPEYEENGINTIKLIYYFNEKKWFFILT